MPEFAAPGAEAKGDLQQLFNAIPIGVLLVRSDGTIALANRSALDLFGYGSDELVGLNVDALVPTEFRAVHVNHRAAYAADPAQRPMGFGRDLHGQRKDGTTFPVEIGLSPFQEGDRQSTMCTVVDITERKRLDVERERLLQTLEEKNFEITALYRVSELTRSGMLDADVLAEIAEAVRSALLASPVAGVRITLDGAVIEDSQFSETARRLDAEIAVERRPRGTIEVFLDADGGTRGENDRLVSVFAGMIAEAQERSEAMTKVIHASQLASIGELAAGIGHEVNNPINGIINCVDILLRKAEEGTKERQYLDLIRQESHRIASIVGSLLAFSRSGRSTSSTADIATILENVLVLCNKRIEKSRIQLEVAVDDGLPRIACQPEQMQQVLLNLVLNAVHALDQRYPEADPGKVLKVTATQTTNRGQTHVEIGVEDRGTGIRPEYRDRIFDPFFTTKGQHGTGLGLAVSLNIVRSYGGWITVDSEHGTYTRFLVQCPVDPAEREAREGGP